MPKLNQQKLWKRANGPDSALYLQRKQDELRDYKRVFNCWTWKSYLLTSFLQRRDRMIADCATSSISPKQLLAALEPHVYNICETKFILKLAKQTEVGSRISINERFH